ncbi:MAG: DEAD/DEAH box helicase [Erysipelotrichaceae bacterium]
MKFEQLGIIAPILKAVEEEGYVTPSKIQEQAIPIVLTGQDLLGCAQTGTGKTAAFAIPILQHCHNVATRRKVRALILTPTRELALQIEESFTTYGKYLDLKTIAIFGGVKQKNQVDKLKQGVDILVATPGRLLDLINQRLLSIKDVEIFVLDEADRMLDMGFVHDVKKVVTYLPEQRQTLFFSATMPKEIQKLVSRLLHDYATVTVAPVSSTVDVIQQNLYYVDQSKKKDLLKDIIKEQKMQTVLVFVRTKHNANRLAKYLVSQNIEAAAIHGDKTQNARQAALQSFKNRQVRVLVATDIAARGIDIEQLPYVINFDLPNVPETFVHRIGRTARAGREGTAISFAAFDEIPYVKDIEKLTKKTFPVIEEHAYPMQNLEVKVKAQPQPRKKRTQAKSKSDATVERNMEKEQQRGKRKSYADRKPKEEVHGGRKPLRQPDKTKRKNTHHRKPSK